MATGEKAFWGISFSKSEQKTPELSLYVMVLLCSPLYKLGLVMCFWL